MLSTDGIESLGDDVDIELFKTISDKVILEFTENNVKIFKTEDEVTLNLKLKNVKNLSINIFEFNAETYYRKQEYFEEFWRMAR